MFALLTGSQLLADVVVDSFSWSWRQSRGQEARCVVHQDARFSQQRPWQEMFGTTTSNGNRDSIGNDLIRDLCVYSQSKEYR